MTRWELWRQGDNDGRFKMAEYGDRVEALGRVLELEAGLTQNQAYWVEGPPGPACRTNRDLYERLLGAGERMNAAGCTLDEFLRSWWLVSRPLSGRRELDLDTVAAMVTAAAGVTPPPLRTVWRTESYEPVSDPVSYAEWEAIVLSQIADLADFAEQGPLDDYASFGVDAPRPPGCNRANGLRWYNFDPRSYLECGMAGSLGGWDEDDGLRRPVAGPVVPLAAEPAPGVHAIDVMTWADLACLVVCGQEYE